MKRIKQELKELIAKATLEFYHAQLTGGVDGGDISVLDAETHLVYILPRPNEKLPIPNWGVIKPEHVVVMDLDGAIQEDNGILATVEAPMHLCVYKARKDIKAIVHSHGQWSSVFAICGRDIPACLAEQILYLGGETLCAEYGLVGSVHLGENIAKALGEKRMTALLRNHGAVACGKDMEEALMRAILLEKGAETTLFGMLLGGAKALDPKNILDPSLLDEDGNARI